MTSLLFKNKNKLRYGYTTGTCAAAAAKASVKMFFSKERIDCVSIDTPAGWTLPLPVDDIIINRDFTSCSITKDSGDDPDVTNGIKIYAKVERDKGIKITGGTGIGIVTRKGLAVEPGNYAINPCPMAMIRKAIEEVLPPGEGVKVEISAPEGIEMAKKTFNEKLGIIGGISILGTTGIVEPMSEEAVKESLALQISLLKEEGFRKLIFVPGKYGINFIKEKLFLKEQLIVPVSNFAGYMLERAIEYGINEVLWVGHIGKLVKIAGGIFHTHSRIADGRMEILASNCAFLGGPQDLVKKIMNSNTTEEAIDYIKNYKLQKVFELIALKVSQRCKEYTRGKISVGTLIFSMDHGILGICPEGKKLLEELKSE